MSDTRSDRRSSSCGFRITARKFYFEKLEQPNRTRKVIKEHAKATPIGYVHDGQPMFWKARASIDTGIPNSNNIWK